MKVTPVKAGDSVRIVDENYVEHMALVTTAHGEFREESSYVPCINVVYVSQDASKRDPYGQQLERLSSLGHVSLMQGMPRPGRYWENV